MSFLRNEVGAKTLLVRPFKFKVSCKIFKALFIITTTKYFIHITGADPGGPGPPNHKNEAPAPKFYKTEAPEWQF